MTDARWQQVKALFEATLERPPSERARVPGCRDRWRRRVAS